MVDTIELSHNHGDVVTVLSATRKFGIGKLDGRIIAKSLIESRLVTISRLMGSYLAIHLFAERASQTTDYHAVRLGASLGFSLTTMSSD
jgi:hypothetical protein